MSTDLAFIAPGGVDEAGLALAQAVAQLPLPRDEVPGRWSIQRTTAAWLRSKRSEHTQRAYFRDLADYLAWCDAGGLDPRQAMRGDVDTYRASLETRLRPAPASLARRLSTLSSWYKYLVSNRCAIANPVDAVDRPSTDRDTSTTAGLTGAEVGLFMRTARGRKGKGQEQRNAAMLGFMAELALRVGEVTGLDLENLRRNRGHRTVRVKGKGGKWRELPIAAPLGRDLDAYLTERGDAPGPLFITRTGKRVDRMFIFRLVREVAGQAGLTVELSPHGLRHTAITAAFDAKAEMRDVQDFAGHADPRTTRRYDRGRGSLDRSPAYLIANLFAVDDGHEDRGDD